MARSMLLSLVAVCLLAVFAVAGCKPKAEAEIKPTINPPAPTAPIVDINKLPPSDIGTTDKPVGVLPPVTPPPPVAGGHVHTMAKGDTYFSLAEKYYGKKTAAGAKKIQEANPKYPDPTKVPVGAQIVIP